jgi:hypothetical protein
MPSVAIFARVTSPKEITGVVLGMNPASTGGTIVEIRLSISFSKSSLLIIFSLP